jgi:hypothetical protein
MFKGLYKSTDNGATWTATAMTGFPTGGLAYEQINDIDMFGGKLYAGSYRGLFVSTDNGDNWTKLTYFADTVIIDLFAAGGKLFIATDKKSVYSTTDGSAFNNMSSGLVSNATTFAAIGSTLYTSQGSGSAGGVFKYTGILSGTETASTSLSTITVYPNPCKDESLHITGFTNQPANITIYTITGSRLNTTTISNTPGEMELDLSLLNAGIYLLHIDGTIKKIIKE